MFRQHIAHMCAESVPWLKEQKNTCFINLFGGSSGGLAKFDVVELRVGTEAVRCRALVSSN